MSLRIAFVTVAIVTVSVASARADDERQAIERALDFMDKDAVKWQKERKCATCHHGTMTLWAFSEARRLGFPISDEKFDDTAKWTKTKLEKLGEPRDTRPGWNLINPPAVWLAISSRTIPGQTAITADDTRRIADHVIRHQETDGCFLTPPPKNGRPPVFESPELITALASLALQSAREPDDALATRIATSRTKADAWLAKASRTGTTQLAALRLLAIAWNSDSPGDIQPEVEALLRRQHADGGWGQRDDLASDAYATGQTLYFLRVVGVSRERAEIRRTVRFLLSQQRADGSWPITPRAQPGESPAKNVMPITYFASAWATLGLLRAGEK